MKKVAQDVRTSPSSKLAAPFGDIDSLPFMEAIRRCAMNWDAHTLFVTSTLVPLRGRAGVKHSSPRKHSVKAAQHGASVIQPDILLFRNRSCSWRASSSNIALFCNVAEEAVLTRRTSPASTSCRLVFAREGGYYRLP